MSSWLLGGLAYALGGVIACSSDAGNAPHTHGSTAPTGGGFGGGASPSGGSIGGSDANGPRRGNAGGASASGGTTASGGMDGAGGGDGPEHDGANLGPGGSSQVEGAGGTTQASGGAGTSGAGNGASGETSSTAAPTLFYLDVVGGRVLRAKADGSEASVIVAQRGGQPDGIAVDVEMGRVFWTNMGRASESDGFIRAATLEGSSVETVVSTGATFTPKQMKLDSENAKLYWADREGMRVMRVNVDGTGLETLVTIAEGDVARRDPANWAVGVAVDVERSLLYWTQKGGDNGGVGSIRRAGLEIPPGESPASRSDVEVLLSDLPEPIDLELDPRGEVIYWTDRGDNTVSKASLDAPAGSLQREIVVRSRGELIGIALDVSHDRLFYTSLAGSVWQANLDGSHVVEVLKNQGALTGLAAVPLLD